jgi:hypothetical protein
VLALSDRLRRRGGVVARDLSGSAVLVDMTGGLCWELNDVGAQIWAQLDGNVTLGQIHGSLVGRYPAVPATVLEQDLLRLVEALLSHDLLEHVPGAAP